jgi:hypothetical protein
MSVEDFAGIAVPTPERAQVFYENHEFYWLSRDRKSYTGKDHVQMLVEHRDLFGFTDAEIARVKEPLIDQRETADRYLHLAELAIERGWISILVNKLASIAPRSLPLAVFWFFAETEEVYSRITDWLKSKGIREGVVRLRTIMMRSWDQPVQSLYARTQFSKSGTKPTCPVCGAEIGTEELIMRGVCPRCGTKLW